MSNDVIAALKVFGAEKFSQAFESAARSVDRLKETSGQIQSAGKKISSVGSSLTSSITKPAMVATSAVAGLVTTMGFKRLTGIDNAKAKLTGLGYDGQQVEGIMGEVSEAIKTGMTTMDEGVNIAAGAMAAGVEQGDDLQRYIKLVGDAAVGANRPVDEMAQIFNRVQGSGKLMTNELNSIEAGMPGFSQAMAEHLGVGQEEFRKMVTAGEVGTEEFLDVMDDFAGGMAEAFAGTFSGMWGNIKAYIAIIGEALVGGLFEDIKSGMQKVIDVLSSEEALAWAEQTGEKIREVSQKVVDAVKTIVEWWNQLSEPIQNTIKDIVKFGSIALVAIGPVLKIVGLLTTAFGFLISPIGLAISAMVALGAVVIYLWNTNEEFRDGMMVIWEAIKNMFSAVWDAISDVFMSVAEPLMAWFKQNQEGIRDVISTIWESVTIIISGAVELVSLFITNTFGAVKNFIDNNQETIKTIIDTAWNIITGVIDTALSLISGIIETVLGIITGDWSRAWNGVKKVASTIWESIKSIISTLINAIWDVISRVVSSIVGTVTDKFEAVRSAISEKMKAAKRVVSTAVDNIKEFFNIDLYASGKAMIASVGRGITAAKDAVIRKASKVAEKVRNLWPFSPAKEGPLSDIHKMDFAGPIGKSINNARKPIQRSMQGLASVAHDNFNPTMNINGSVARSNAQMTSTISHEIQNKGTTQPAYLYLQLGKNEYKVFVDDITRTQDKKAQLELSYR